MTTQTSGGRPKDTLIALGDGAAWVENIQLAAVHISGQVEAMNKSLIGDRMRRSGMHWLREGAARVVCAPNSAPNTPHRF